MQIRSDPDPYQEKLIWIRVPKKNSGEIYNAQIYTENLTDEEIIKLTTQ